MSESSEEGRRTWLPIAVWGGVVGATFLGLTRILASGRVDFAALFMGLAGVALLLALAALWQSLRTAFGGGGPQVIGAIGLDLPERAALLEEKRTLLRAIKDIAYEREVGKMSDTDFQRLDRAYRARAREVLRLLDQDLEPFLKQAEALVAEALDEEAAPPYRGSERVRRKRTAGGKKGSKKKKRREPDAPPALECPGCGTENDPDARFCKHCARALQDGAEAPRGQGDAGPSARDEAAQEGAHDGPEAPRREGPAKSSSRDEDVAEDVRGVGRDVDRELDGAEDGSPRAGTEERG